MAFSVDSLLYTYSSRSYICSKCVPDVIKVKCPDYNKAFKDLGAIIEKQKVRVNLPIIPKQTSYKKSLAGNGCASPRGVPSSGSIASPASATIPSSTSGCLMVNIPSLSCAKAVAHLTSTLTSGCNKSTLLTYFSLATSNDSSSLYALGPRPISSTGKVGFDVPKISNITHGGGG